MATPLAPLRALALLLLGAAFAAPSGAATLTTTWTGAGGAWSDAGSWSDAVPSNGGGDTWRVFVDGGNAATAADVAFDLGIAEIDELTIDANDRVAIGSNQNLAVVGGTLAVDGELALEGGPGFAVLRAGGTLNLGGAGTLSMSDAIENTLSGITGSTPHLVVGSQATIRGAGRIGIDVLRITNHGVIESAGTNPLEINPNLLGLTSDGVLRASTGSTLRLLGRNGGDFALDGAVDVASNARLELTEFADATGSAQYAVDGTLAVDATSTLATSGDLAARGALEIDGLLAVHDAQILAGTAVGVAGVFEVAGDLQLELSDATGWNWDAAAELVMSGGVGSAVGQWDDWASLEVAGADLGVDPGTHSGNPVGFQNVNHALPELVIDAGAHVLLADLFDNGNRAGGAEALYVDTLRFADGAGLLNLNGLNLYFNNLVGNQSQIINSPVPEPGSGGLLAAGLLALAAARRRARS